jgi:YbbR domain-containing protein
MLGNAFKKFDEILASPWALWTLSLAIAVSMWFYVTGAGDPGNVRRKFLYPVSYRGLPAQLVLKNVTREVEVEVEAPEAVMDRLKYDSISCEVDLGRLSAGKYRESIRTVLPPNVTLTSVIPSEVDVELIRQVSRVFAVDVELPPDIPSGQYLEAVTVVPKEVGVKGTEKDLAKIGAARISPTLQELEANRELFLPVKIAQSAPFEDEVILEPSQVRVNATLATGLPRKKVPVNVRLSGKPHEDYAVRSVTTEPAEVMAQGERAKLDLVSAVETETVDITGVSSDQVIVVPLRPLAEGDVSMTEVKSVRLSIQLEPIRAQAQISGLSVVLEGAEGAADKWLVTPSLVDVTLEAAPSLMAAFDPKAVAVFVDVSKIFLPSAVLPVRGAVSSDDFKIVKIDPPTVTVTEVGKVGK